MATTYPASRPHTVPAGRIGMCQWLIDHAPHLLVVLFIAVCLLSGISIAAGHGPHHSPAPAVTHTVSDSEIRCGVVMFCDDTDPATTADRDTAPAAPTPEPRPAAAPACRMLCTPTTGYPIPAAAPAAHWRIDF